MLETTHILQVHVFLSYFHEHLKMNWIKFQKNSNLINSKHQ